MIAAVDELALEQAKRLVERALEPHVRSVQITVTPGVLSGGGEGDRFQFGNEETE